MHIKAENGLFVCAEQGGGLNGFERRDALIANRVEAREWEADCIVIGSHRSSDRSQGFFARSVSIGLAANAECSIEIVR